MAIGTSVTIDTFHEPTINLPLMVFNVRCLVKKPETFDSCEVLVGIDLKLFQPDLDL